jgi:hypothetical protein
VRRWIVTLLCALVLAGPVAVSPAPDDCNLTFTGSYRKAVKLRSPNLSGYGDLGTLTVSDRVMQMHKLDPKVPRKPQTNTPAMKGIETNQVALHGFLVGVKFENHQQAAMADNDFHCEVADSPQWDSDHIVVEVPPGTAYCVARKAVWKLVKDDSQHSGKPLSDTYVLDQPVQVDVAGYVFLDGAHARKGTKNYTDAKGKDAGRGIRGPDGTQQVRGLWEVHPVLGVRVVQ